jgi:Ca2+-binding RTX toxin-like protein
VDAGSGDDAVAFLTLDGAVTNSRVDVRLGDGDDYCSVGTELRNPGDRFTVDGGAGDDLINTGDGSDSISGGAGADTLDGWAGADTVSGGAGSDTFEFFSGEAFTVFAALDQILDWSSEDRLYFADGDITDPIGTASAANYVAATRGDYGSALAFANAQIAGGFIDYVAVQVGGDVYVFCDSYYDAGDADSAVRLVGRSLADIGPGNFTDIGD